LLVFIRGPPEGLCLLVEKKPIGDWQRCQEENESATIFASVPIKPAG
jgi:hypothetical protein